MQIAGRRIVSKFMTVATCPKNYFHVRGLLCCTFGQRVRVLVHAVGLKVVYGSTNEKSLPSTVHRVNDAVIANTSRTAAAELMPIILFANRQNFFIEMFGGNVALKPVKRTKQETPLNKEYLATLRNLTRHLTRACTHTHTHIQTHLYKLPDYHSSPRKDPDIV